MARSDYELAARFPLLFARQRWERGGIDAQFTTALPRDGLVTNVHVVGFAGDQIVVCRDQRGGWMLPGGTREPGESIAGCAGRELLEEAGAHLAGPLAWIGAHYCVSDRPRPYRPHQPHPQKAWLWCAADVRVDSVRAMPAGAEQIAEVAVTGVAQARRLLKTGWLAEMVLLAAELRSAQR